MHRVTPIVGDTNILVVWPITQNPTLPVRNGATNILWSIGVAKAVMRSGHSYVIFA